MGKKVVFNESQLSELKKMMDDHVRQIDIAKHFGVTDDTIRRICRENGFEVKMPHKCKCVICGDTFYSNIKGTRTCKKEHHRICKICGKDFIVDRYDIRETCKGKCASLLKYGVDHHGRAPEVVARRQRTVQERYGVSNVSQLPEHKEKSEATMLEKYGATSWAGSEIGRSITRARNLEKFGCEEPLADPRYRDAIDRINLEKYGTIYPMQTDSVKQKQQNTLMERYGVNNPMKDSGLMERQHQSVFSNYGETCPMRIPEVKEKIMERSMEKYGVPWPIMNPENRKLSCHSKINIRLEEVFQENGIEFVSEFPLGRYVFDDKCGDILVELDPTWSHNSHQSCRPDCEPNPPHYHRDKSRLAESKGYRCIHIFDWDEWDQIIDLLKKKEIIYARKCTTHSISKKVAEEFTRCNHIQGSCYGQMVNYGLYLENELVQVMTFGKPRYNKKYDLELLRLCSRKDLQVIGGASKLFKRFKQDNPGKSIISYCDSAKFSGKVYEQMGMRLSHVTEPAKIWSKGNKRITDNLLRQRGYDQLFNANYGKGTSNEQLMLEHGWLPVFDCGQKVFVYEQKVKGN